MNKRLLICTVGRNRERVATALRELGHDKLVVITTEPSTFAVRDAQKFEELACAEYELVRISDKHDFNSMFAAFVKTIEKHKEWDVRANISGGPKLLSIAGMIACYTYGISAFHCEERSTPLPVLKGFALSDTLSLDVRIVAKALGKRAEKVDKISTMTKLDKKKVEKAIRTLKRLGLAATHRENGILHARITEAGATYRMTFATNPTNARALVT